MPSRRTKKVMHEGVSDTGTLERGREFWKDFPGDRLCVCGHLLNRHVMNMSEYGGCVEFTGGHYCPCKKFEPKE